MESQFSNPLDYSVPNGAPNAPLISGELMYSGGSLLVTVELPTTDADGGPLTGLKNCYLFIKETPFGDSTPEQERQAGTRVMSQPISEIPGGRIVFQVTNIVYGKTYYFVASVDD